jgi:hypothetical protein
MTAANNLAKFGRKVLLLEHHYQLGGLVVCARCGGMFIGHNARCGAYRYYACQSKKKLGAEACGAKALPKAETEAAVIGLLRDELLTPAYIKQLVDLVNEEANAGSAAARSEIDAVAAQLAEANGSSAQAVIDALVAEVTAHFDEEVAAGEHKGGTLGQGVDRLDAEAQPFGSPQFWGDVDVGEVGKAEGTVRCGGRWGGFGAREKRRL